MKGGSKLFIFTGVALALVTVLLAITMTSSPQKGKSQDDDKPDKVKVVKAAADFEPHKVISMADIVIEEMSTDQVPPDAATDTAAVLGQSYKLGAVKGDILLNSYLEAPGITNSIAAGKRAFSLALDEREMMSGLIMDGDYVDVIFDARVDINRILPIQGLEIMEDGDYVIKFDDSDSESESGDDSGDEDNSLQITPGEGAYPYQGKPGSEFTLTDMGGYLEPVTKILVQDVKVIRVVKPGVSYDAQGQQVTEAAEGVTANQNSAGQLILEVTPQQAEVLSFMQQSPEDEYKYHDVEVIVRGKDDHEVANTSGITFQILVEDRDWRLPYPKPILLPGE